MDQLFKDIAAAVAILAAAFALFRGVWEFVLQGRQKRAEMVLLKQKEYFGNDAFNRIRNLLETDNDELRNVQVEAKRAYLTYFEEIALLTNSGIVNARLSYYLFGYYAVKCFESQNFWSNLEKAPIFWNVFLSYAGAMQKKLREEKLVVPAHQKI